MRLFTYILTWDNGFAPNPFGRYCTLACCKPVIRRVAQEGDIVVGISPRSCGNKLVYAMELTEVPIGFDAYFMDQRFQDKKPCPDSNDPIERCGDNIYEPRPDGTYRQRWSLHSSDAGQEDDEMKEADLSGKRVLVSESFWYFGENARDLLERFRQIIPGRGHRSIFSDDMVAEFREYIHGLSPGRCGNPSGCSCPPTESGW